MMEQFAMYRPPVLSLAGGWRCVNATNSVSIVDTDYQATIHMTSGTHLFRLKKP